jgi:hypothetical protein
MATTSGGPDMPTTYLGRPADGPRFDSSFDSSFGVKPSSSGLEANDVVEGYTNRVLNET